MIEIEYLNQGSVKYVIKQLVFDDRNKEEYKNLFNTKLEEKEKVEHIVKLSKYNNYIKNIKIADGELILTYQYYAGKQVLHVDNLALFTLIDDLNKITCNFENSKTEEYNNQTNQSEKLEISQESITREEINSIGEMTTENYAEFIKNY